MSFCLLYISSSGKYLEKKNCISNICARVPSYKMLLSVWRRSLQLMPWKQKLCVSGDLVICWGSPEVKAFLLTWPFSLFQLLPFWGLAMPLSPDCSVGLVRFPQPFLSLISFYLGMSLNICILYLWSIFEKEVLPAQKPAQSAFKQW